MTFKCGWSEWTLLLLLARMLSETYGGKSKIITDINRNVTFCYFFDALE
jgi:hypothetical protein